MQFLLLIVLALASADEQTVIPFFSPLYLNDTLLTGYSINGTLYTNYASPPTSNPAQFAIDRVQGKMMYDLGRTVGAGVYVLFPTISYVYDIFTVGTCFKITNWTYYTQIDEYAYSLSTLGSTRASARWAGLVGDVGGCSHKLSSYIRTIGGIVVEHYFGQRMPSSPTTCGTVTGTILYDILTLNISPDRSRFWELPSYCANATEYCDFVYPPGNPCIINP